MKTRIIHGVILTGLVTAVGLCPPVLAQLDDAGRLDKQDAEKVFPTKPPYSPYAGRSFPTRPLFGDTHLHTALSMDAAVLGNRLSPEEAFRFARGVEVTTSSGQRARLSRPLDFLMVADHAEAYGVITELKSGNPLFLADPMLKRWSDLMNAGGESAHKASLELRVALEEGKLPKVIMSPKIARSVWEKHVATADRYNEPGKFTALIGYEWSTKANGDLHRVIVFRDAADKAIQTLPFSALQSPNVEDLWKWMAAYEEKTGGQLLAIPHNGNLSNGRMFELLDFQGRPLTRQYAETRAQREPLYEVTQIKGTSETHPFLSPDDEFADFEIWDKGSGGLTVVKTAETRPKTLPGEYARSALKNGLKLAGQLGTNPFKFGLIGSTDSHTSLSTAEENNFFGKASIVEPSAERTSKVFDQKGDVKVMMWQTAASGYAAVWAAENTREAVFDALERKEVYGTTGPRMLVRFFGGFDFEPKDAQTRRPAVVGYTKGVPMGGDLRDAPKGKAPTFLVAALKDPIGANLDRYQIVKGWLDKNGELHEKVYDVAWSGERKPDAHGKLPAVGNTVDVANTIWTNTIGAPELIAVWKDPDFDPQQRAFYYGRVIEIPTPRWTAYDAKYYGVQLPKDVPMITTERAYTSPIWYTP